MAPGYGSGYSQEVRVTLDGLGELPAEMWGDYGVPWSDVADAKTLINRSLGMTPKAN